MKDIKQKASLKSKYIENAISRIQIYIFGMCIGSNLKGINGDSWHYENGERGRQEIEKVIRRLVKYLTNTNK